MIKILFLVMLLFAVPTFAAKPPKGLTCPAPVAATAGKVIVNEFSYHGESANHDWIEIFVNDGPQNLNGWQFILRGPGNNDSTVTIGDVTIPWNNNTAEGRFIIFASSTQDASIQAAIDNEILMENTNLFIIPEISLHNTRQEILLLDADGNLVYYIGNGNENNPKFEYDCVEKYPDYADEIRQNGNEDQACTVADGVSNGGVSDDWQAGCNGQTTPGYSNNEAATLSHFQIEHSASGDISKAQAIVIKACANSNCSILLSEQAGADIVLSLGEGNFSNTALNFINGQATTNLNVLTPQTIVLAIQNPVPEGPFKCVDDLNGTSCEITFTKNTAEPSQCLGVFPNGASTHSNSGNIFFGYNSQLLGSDDKLLATGTVGKNGGSNKNTCDSAGDCEAGGTPSDTSEVVFQNSSSDKNIPLGFKQSVEIGSGSFASNEFKDINAGGASQASITFSNSHSEYFVDRLVLGFKNTLYLQAGATYWFNQLSLNSQSEIIIQGTGTALIYVNQSVNFPSPGLINSPSINSSGDASKLAMHVSSDVNFNNNSTFSGSLYVAGDLSMGSSSYAFGAVSAANIDLGSQSTITYKDEEMAATEYGDFCGGQEAGVHHYRIEHDAQGFTCEAETMIIKACADENCDILYDQETAIQLSPLGWEGENPFVFVGEHTISLKITDEGTFTLSKVSAIPEADLHCFNGDNETCDISFSNDGFEIYGANFSEPLPDQLAAADFVHVNVRAVRNVENVCQALLQGPQEIELSYDCVSPNQCVTPLNGIAVVGDGTGVNSGLITVEFDGAGVASLDVLNYPDAGRITISVAATVDGVTFNHSDQEPVDVYPSYLALGVTQSELLFSGVGNQNNYVAGEDFTFVVGAYGVNDQLLPNYHAETPQLQVTRVIPNNVGDNGRFRYSVTGQKASNGAFSNIADISGDGHFEAGEYRFTQAYYTEVGRIEIDLRDADYLGNLISSKDKLLLGDFYPAYFKVELSEQPVLAHTCNNTFSYIGQNIGFVSAPEFTLSAYNALDAKTNNYSGAHWNYFPDELILEGNVSYLDSSVYAADNSASVIDLGDAPIVSNNDNYDGTGTVSIINGRFRYNKVSPNDNSAFVPVSPFEANITVAFTQQFFTSTFTDQNGDQDAICYQLSYNDNTCLGWDIVDVTGTQMRYGRLKLESTYGPENEQLNVPIKAEYYDNGQWLTNTEDNCTSIAFTEAAGEIIVTPIDGYDTNLLGEIESTGELLSGKSVDDQFALSAPGESLLGPGIQGQVKVSLDPEALNVDWTQYLNYDWNGDGFIDSEDSPEATVTFGLFRGNDSIIQWREVYN
ncbi:DUF6701 domain-containing protein [uncultured Paraglaciecola sp.]|uniref:DUF6701 domain-containing protein n=1 Tax=uncultured Paraglaciecola sp. TaxID=1765024 RepID=UPI00261F7254|nr:DUF6701 domain-containing protein [uncultured Paraglaciecola sp.]